MIKKILPFIVGCLMASATLFGCASTQEEAEESVSGDESGVEYTEDESGSEDSEASEEATTEEQVVELDKEAAIGNVFYGVSSSWAEHAIDTGDGSTAIAYDVSPETQLVIAVNTQKGQHPVSLEDLNNAYSAKVESFTSTEHPGSEWTDGMAEEASLDGIQGYERTWDVLYTLPDGNNAHEFCDSVEFANEDIFVEVKMTTTVTGEDAPNADELSNIFDAIAGSLSLQSQE